ncbi:MAG: heavy metal translocating P-type ATPase [Planctomycetes bacterium]|nr:heavy metal translocating P-type ATPase [Planctomycetota bacterium]
MTPELAIDPVCGMRVDPTKARFRSEHGGKHIFFCASVCKQRFDAAPEKYLSPAAPAAGMENPFAAALAPAPAAARPLPAAHKAPAVAAAPKPQEVPAGTRWICPMCPEVNESKPGPCPICGMPLEPALTSGTPSGAEMQHDEVASLRRRFVIGLVLGAPVFVDGMGSMLGWAPHRRWIGGDHSPIWMWMQLLLSGVVAFGVGLPFFRAGFAGVGRGRFNMFTLIALGVAAAWGFSTLAFLVPSALPEAMRAGAHAPMYYESAATITVLVVLGQWLEARARRRASNAVRELLTLQPAIAHRMVADGEEDVPLDQIGVGDRLRVRPGERVPVDGAIVEGEASIDESSVTGEAIPADRRAGEQVVGGTVNLHTSFVMKAERVGRETLLARVVAAVEEAQRSRAPIARLADRVTQWFVPAVVAAAVLTFAGWMWLGPEPRIAYAFASAVTVLIVACPCALGLATPMAIVAGAGRAARSGVLVRDAQALEAAESVDVVIVDKTGTLTEGRPAVREWIPQPGVAREELLRSAAAVEIASEHPLARAIVDAAASEGVAPQPGSDFAAEIGRGARARVAGAVVRVGTLAFAEEEGAQFTSVATRARDLAAAGSTVVFISSGGRALGAVAMADRLRASTPAALEALRGLGVKVIMATGDREATARALAAQIDVHDVRAELSPLAKADLVREERARGRRVAMAGDGINDAPALAAADVGIAMGSGTGIAMEAAPITLVRGDLRGVARALVLSRATMRTVRQNLFWAFAYNVAGVPFAAGVGAALAAAWGVAEPMRFLVGPVWASVAMSLSSLIVVGNSLRLLRR